MVEQDGRVEQHADGDEEQHGKGIAQRQRFRRRLLAERGLAEDHPGEEGAEREGDSEEGGRTVGHTQCDHQDAQAEEFARAGVDDVVQEPGNHPAAHHQHRHDEGCDLDEGQAKRQQHVPEIGGDGPRRLIAGGPVACEAGQRWHEH